MNRLSRGLALACALIGGGCQSPPTLPTDSGISVSIATDLTTYPSGGVATFRIRNTDQVAYQFGAVCESVMEVNHGGEWQALPQSDVPCPSIGLILAPGEEQTLQLHLGAEWTPGQYRLRFDFHDYPGSGQLSHRYRRSNAFSITS